MVFQLAEIAKALDFCIDGCSILDIGLIIKYYKSMD
jgi:hypothetical protein